MPLVNRLHMAFLHPLPLKASRTQEWLSVCGLLIFTTVWRFYQVRHLALPAWVDSVHHTLLVRILLEQGTIPATWGPYLPDTPFYYHFGFHASAALLAKICGLTGLQLGQAVLIVGQLWQVLLVLGVYLLGRALFAGEPAAHEKAFIAMLLVSLVSEMPAFYVSWGRYTLLAGATLLIGAMAAATAHRWYALTILTALTAITHHYALFLLAIFLIISWLGRPRQRVPLCISAITAAMLISPWLWRVWRLGRQWIALGTAPDVNAYAYILSLLGPLHNYVLLLIAVLGCLIRVWQMRQDAMLRPRWLPFGIWTLLLCALLGPWQLAPFRADHAVLFIFLPGVIFAAAALGELPHPPARWAAVLALLFWGMGSTRNIVRPETVIATAADVAAIEWLAANTPADATFLIDAAPWQGFWRGVDGGWWITPLTGRRTTPPPIAYGWSPLSITQRYNAPPQRLFALTHGPPADYCWRLLTLMQDARADYYYTRLFPPQNCRALALIYVGSENIALYKRQ
ncbi:MAG: hypothetical protein R3A44_44815 [Caldilineaceae bacterium]